MRASGCRAWTAAAASRRTRARKPTYWGRHETPGAKRCWTCVWEGEAFALPYSHLSLIKLEGEGALTLSFSTHLVKIEGERLRPLYEALLDHTVRHVIAASAPTRDRVPATEPLIASIDLVPLGQGDHRDALKLSAPIEITRPLFVPFPL